MANFLGTFLLPASLAGGLLCFLALLLRPLWRRLGAGYLRAVLLACGLFFFLPFGLSAPLKTSLGLPSVGQTHLFTTASSTAEAMAPRSQQTPAASASDAGQTPSAASLPSSPAGLLAGLYLAGLGVTLVASGGQYLRFMHKLRKTRQPVASANTLQEYQALCQAYNLRRPPALYQSAALRAPALAGVLRPVIYLPTTNPASAKATQFALQHELTHYRHGDIPLKWAMQALCALHWFNPLAWWLGHTFGESCEFYCDECVTRPLTHSGRLGYAGTLLGYASSPCPPQPLPGFTSPAKALKRRMNTLLHPALPSKRLRAAATTLAGVLALGGLLAGCSLIPVGKTEASSATLAASSAPSSPSIPAAPSATSSPAAPAAPSAPAAPLAPVASSAAQWPVPSSNIISRHSGLGEEKNGHRGIDINAENGSPIVAVMPGVVTTAAWHYSYGNHVVIDHGDGLSTLYAHCAALLVEEGQAIQAGAEIATVGASGNVTGNALHFEVHLGGALQDPLAYLTPAADIPA